MGGTLYFQKNKPSVPTFGSASIDVLVGPALAAGAWSVSTTIYCYGDWSPRYALGGPSILSVTLLDQAEGFLSTATKTINPGTNYVPVPLTLVGTITYNADSSFTLN